MDFVNVGVGILLRDRGMQPVFILTFSYYMIGHED